MTQASTTSWAASGAPRMRLAEIFDLLVEGPSPVRFTAYDGSASGPEDAAIGIHLANPRAAAFMATAPGSLGMARGYVAGDLVVSGIHPGDPYPLLVALDAIRWRRPARW